MAKVGGLVGQLGDKLKAKLARTLDLREFEALIRAIGECKSKVGHSSWGTSKQRV